MTNATKTSGPLVGWRRLTDDSRQTSGGSYPLDSGGGSVADGSEDGGWYPWP
jgi:hypothetical protein